MTLIEGEIIGTFRSKSGREVLIRALRHDDVAAMMEYINALSLEDTYILMSGEQMSHENELWWVQQSIDAMTSGNKVHLTAWVGDMLVGVCEARRMTELRKRSLHVAEVGLTVRAEFRSDGIGSLLLRNTMQEAAKMDGIRMLRLWVFGPNTQAKNLYKKLGFVECGSIPEAILRKGEYISHDLMYKKI